MTPLAQRIAPRGNNSDIVVGPAGSSRLMGKPSITEANPAVVGLCITDPVAFIETLVALDGTVSKLVLVSHALAPETVTTLLENAGCTKLVTDRCDLTIDLPQFTPSDAQTSPSGVLCETSWILTTSGTTGVPKLIPHTLNSLTRTVVKGNPNLNPRWGLLYDPTRFAGLQVELQALIGGGTLIAPNTSDAIAAQVNYLHTEGCTHLSATPTLWRRLLMAPGFTRLALTQITLGGEIVDQQIIESLRAAHPKARITHIYASTEAGVGFAVTDEQAGFPLHYLQDSPTGIGMKVVDDVLWLRPPPSARRALSGTNIPVDQDGFIRSGDKISIVDDRAVFLGRDNGTRSVATRGRKTPRNALEKRGLWKEVDASSSC